MGLVLFLGEEEEDFDDEEYGELDSEDEQTLREMGHLPPHGFGRLQLGNMKLPPPGGTNQQYFMNKGQVVSQDVDNEYGAFQNMTTSDTENFLMMGAMAKCLVCNKLIRKNDILQHNMMHIQEDEDDDEEEIEGIHDEVDDLDGEMHGEMGEMHGDMREMHGDMNESHGVVGEMNEDGEMQDLPEEMQEMDENMLEPIQEEMREDELGAEPHGEMHGEGELQDDMREYEDVGEHVDYDAVEGGETDQAAEKRPTDQLPPNTCEICFKTFKNKYSLVKHVKIHDPKDIQCDLCDKTFRLEAYLTKHRKKMHPNARQIPVPQGKDMAESFSSGVCNEATGQQQLEQDVDSK